MSVLLCSTEEVIAMPRYRHSFDIGEYELFKDNDDGSALFLKVRDIEESRSWIVPEARAVLYPWSQMEVITARRCSCERCLGISRRVIDLGARSC